MLSPTTESHHTHYPPMKAIHHTLADAYRRGDVESCDRDPLDLAGVDETLIDVQALTGFPVKVRPSVINGHGVFAARHILPGEVVLEARIEKRVDHRTDTSFELWPGGVHAELTWPAWRINHSCRPNCGVRTRQPRDGGGYDFIAGPHGIAAGEEIVTDYGLHEWISRAVPAGACRCGAVHCRGRSVGWGEKTANERAALATLPTADYLLFPAIVRHLVVGIEFQGVSEAPETVRAWRAFITQLVRRCGLRVHGEPLIADYGDGHLAGWTFAQLVNASSITGHCYRQTRQARIDIVSCRPFDPETVAHWAADRLGAPAYVVTAADRAG